MKKRTRYHLDQSPLYKLKTHKKLAELLLLESSAALKSIINKSENNYYKSKLESGREVEVPLIQLTRIHRRLSSLLNRIEIPDYMNSGIKGRSHIKNGKDHLCSKFLYKIDIKQYYQNVTKKHIEKTFSNKFKCSNDIAKSIAEISCYEDYLPTGSPLSQVMAYISSRSVFDHIYKYSFDRGIKFTVYVDDLTFSGENITPKFKKYISSYLKRTKNFTCHKARNYNPETPKPVTGVIITDDILKVNNKHRYEIIKLRKDLNANLNTKRVSPDILMRKFQVLQGHLFSAGQINGRYKQLGKKIVELRIELGIKAVNQKTKNRINSPNSNKKRKLKVEWV